MSSRSNKILVTSVVLNVILFIVISILVVLNYVNTINNKKDIESINIILNDKDALNNKLNKNLNEINDELSYLNNLMIFNSIQRNKYHENNKYASAFNVKDFDKHMSMIEVGWDKNDILNHCSLLTGLHEPLKQDESTWYYFYSGSDWAYKYYCLSFSRDVLINIEEGSGNRMEEYNKNR